MLFPVPARVSGGRNRFADREGKSFRIFVVGATHRRDLPLGSTIRAQFHGRGYL